MPTKTVSKTAKPRHISNPTGKGGFGEPNRRGAGPGRGNKKAKDEIGLEALIDMKAAYTTKEIIGEKPGIASARKLLHSDYTKFMMIYSKLVSEYAIPGGERPVAAAATPEQAVMGSVGPKEVSVEYLAEQLLSEWENPDVNA